MFLDGKMVLVLMLRARLQDGSPVVKGAINATSLFVIVMLEYRFVYHGLVHLVNKVDLITQYQ